MTHKLFIVVLWLSAQAVFAQGSDALKGIWPVTDSKMKQSLNGEWLLKVEKGMQSRKLNPATDSSWIKTTVPGCWDAYGLITPRYNMPDSLTGYYRTTFKVPASWKGHQVGIRFDGVLRGYDLWLNGHYVGSWESGYNTCQFDLTPYLRARGDQKLTLRVYSHFKGYEFDCNDDWAPMGIFRDVTLFAYPRTHLSDLTVTTKTNGEVRVSTKVANATPGTSVDYTITDRDGHVVSTGGKIQHPHVWSAETPYLYTLHLNVREKGKVIQTFRQPVGIREVSIDGNVLKVNGRAVKLRGVNAHSTDPHTVKMISDSLTLKDLTMMQEASVNFIRLSHYPREPRFYELCDSLGFYLVDEIPFGFGDNHLNDLSYKEILLQRAHATIMRDKNHPSVILWSVGNENPLTGMCVEVGDSVGQMDASRPYCYPQVGSYFRRFITSDSTTSVPRQIPVYAPHYPTAGDISKYFQHLDRPVVFTEYCHTLGISFEDHDRQWEIIELTPGIAGGAVWEWADQGMPFSKKMGSRWRSDGGELDQLVFTTDSSGFEMEGNLGTDGLLYANRTPLPNYYELQHNYARAFVKSVSIEGNAVKLSIVNRYDFLDLHGHVRFHWYLTNGLDTIKSGVLSPDCPARSTTSCRLELPPQTGLSLLCVDIEDADRHTFLRQSFVLNKPAFRFSGTSSPTRFIQQGPFVRTGRKATMAERITQKGRLIQKYLLPLANKEVKADVSSTPMENGEDIRFTLSPDTADVFRAELGIGYLLASGIDRVAWIGYGPYPSYPGRHQANRYGLWSRQMDDLYFEGNHSGIDAAFFSDKEGNGVLVSGDSLSLNFEQTDRGIVMTVNAAVSGQGPKFRKTLFPCWKKGDSPVSSRFQLFGIDSGEWPAAMKGLFATPDKTEKPFKPFLTQYDTYLLRFEEIFGRE